MHLRLSSLPTPLPFDPQPLPLLGTGSVVHEAPGADTLVLGYGPVLLGEAVRGVRDDAALAGRVRIVDLPWVNAVDVDWLRGALGGIERLMVLDDHDVRSGLGVHVAALVAQHGLGVRVTILGVEGVPECGAPAEMLAHHGLDAGAISATMRAIVG